jgi:hypothetical protein
MMMKNLRWRSNAMGLYPRIEEKRCVYDYMLDFDILHEKALLYCFRLHQIEQALDKRLALVMKKTMNLDQTIGCKLSPSLNLNS